MEGRKRDTAVSVSSIDRPPRMLCCALQRFLFFPIQSNRFDTRLYAYEVVDGEDK
jgi:hypothetical protein